MTFKINYNFDLYPYNTFKFHAISDLFIIIEDDTNIKEIISNFIDNNTRYLLLGSGSNIVFLNNFKGLIIHLVTKGINVKEYQDYFLVKVKAGEIWHDFVYWAISNGMYGLENLSFIPGTVGAAPVQNIGAYGVEVKDFIYKVYCLDLNTKNYLVLNNSDCNFIYRHSIFKKSNFLITDIEFKLRKKFVANLSYGNLQEEFSSNNYINIDDKDKALLLMNIIGKIRASKLPDYKLYGNVGSFFKNPIIKNKDFLKLKENYLDIVYHQIDDSLVKVSAAWLIDFIGFKSLKMGGCRVWEKQPLVLINEEKGTPLELMSLVELIKDKIKATFNLDLEIEPLIVSN